MKRNGSEKECSECNELFYVSKCRLSAKYCSNKCRFDAANTEKNIQRRRKKIDCMNCKVEFEILYSANTKFCSSKCYGEYYKKTGLSKLQNNKLINRFIKRCKYCETEFEVHNYRKNTADFCTVNCYDNHRRNFLICPTCGKHFTSPKYEDRKYCSQHCAAVGIKKRHSKFSMFVYTMLSEEFGGVEMEYLIKTDDRKIFCDIKIGNLIVECKGDYWHCNPIIFSENYFHTKIRKYAKEIWEYDFQRELAIKNIGFDLITVWEHDFNTNRNKFIFNLKRDIYATICKNNKIDP